MRQTVYRWIVRTSGANSSREGPAASPPSAQTTALTPIRVGPELALAAAARLVSQTGGDVEAAARRLVSSAPAHGIDLSLLWATVEEGRKPPVRQACLTVPGAGRTAMLFLSEPPEAGDPGGPAKARAERVSVIDAACRHLAATMLERVQIAQALPDPSEPWFIEAVQAAGFTNVGNLSYLRRAPGPLPRTFRKSPWPKGFHVIPVADLPRQGLDELLLAAMDKSYADTLDCPELCGLRETRDILASHRDTGKFDPASWWVVLRGDEPEGCAFFSPCPDAASCELVYLGLSPAARGQGLGKQLLAQGIEQLRKRYSAWPLTLAVDQRNAPALSLYGAFGFRSFGSRVAFVKPLQGLAPRAATPA